jgi:hypothetical protein
MQKTDNDLSTEAGLNRNYLAVVKSTNLHKYKIIKTIGIMKYKQNQLDLKNDLAQMQIELTDNRRATWFWKNYLQNTFSSKHNFLNGLSSIAFRNNINDMSISSYEKWMYVYELYVKNRNKIYKETENGQ